jgi:ketosteroid isomerase-like protein
MEETIEVAEKDSEARNKHAVQAGFDAWRKGMGSVFDLLAPNANWTIVGNSPVASPEQKKGYANGNKAESRPARLSGG